MFQSGCKTKTSFCISQEKLEKFLKLFFRLFFSFFCQSFKELPCFAGCKCKKLFLFPQAFPNLFFRKFLFSNIIRLPECLRAFFAVAGAKVVPFSSYPSFFPNYFHSFLQLFLNCLITAGLHFNYFWICVRFFCVPLSFGLFCRKGAKARRPFFCRF